MLWSPASSTAPIVSARECILKLMDAEWNLSEDLAAADRRIAEHPGFREYLELETLKRSLMAVFMPNLRELLRLLRAASTNPELAFELVQNVRQPVVRDRFHDELTQRLHNYVASAQSLVDLVRHLLHNREGQIVDDFERRKQNVLRHGEVPFMKCLRNYMLHETLPFSAHTLSMENVNTPAPPIGLVEYPRAGVSRGPRGTSSPSPDRVQAQQVGVPPELGPLHRVVEGKRCLAR